MKKVKNFLGIILAITMLMLLTGCTNASEKSYDTIVLDNASNMTSVLGFDATQDNPFADGTRYFEVSKSSKYEYVIDVNGTEMKVQLPSDTQSSGFIPKNIKKISSEYKDIISSSKKIIYKYIKSSTILQDKDGIKEYIDKLAIKEATFTKEDDVLYINSNNSSYICEWMIVHEFIHAIAYYTHDCKIENEEYAYNQINEVMTDIITSSLNPKIDSSIYSGYSDYYVLVYPYINLVGTKAIEAYFYGYDTIYHSIGKDEFDFFVIVLDHYEVENSDVFYNNLMYKWYATY